MSSIWRMPDGRQILFLHVPRCGGTFAEDVALRLGLRTSQGYVTPYWRGQVATNRHGLTLDYNWYYDQSFTIVRHPLTWYQSVFKFCTRRRWRDFEPERDWHVLRPILACRAPDFHAFMRKVIDAEPGFVTRMVEWFVGPPGRVLVDYVLWYERLHEGLAALLQNYGVEANVRWLKTLDRVNEGGKAPAEWTPELKREVERLEQPLIRRFYAKELTGAFAHCPK